MKDFGNELMQAVTGRAIAQAQDRFSAAVRGLSCPLHRMLASVRVEGRSLDHLAANIRGCCEPFIRRIKQRLETDDSRLDSPFSDQASITNGTMTLQDYSGRRRFAEGQDFQDATPRIVSFVQWRFQVITEHDLTSLVYDPDYLGIHRTDGIVIIQVTLNDGRSLELKKAFYSRVAALLKEEVSIRPENVFINLVEVPKENWSFGNGEAQYAPK